MKKLIIGIVVGIIVGMMSTAYALSEEQKIDIYTDEETKIQYIIVRFTSTAGAGVGICPRYTSNGNLYYVGSIDLCKDSPTSVSGGGIARHIK